MIAARILGAWLAFAVLATATMSDAATPITREHTIHYALENMVSGSVGRTRSGGTDVAVTLLRTWRSESGHWCRRYRLIERAPDAPPARIEETRCRQDGKWLRVAE